MTKLKLTKQLISDVKGRRHVSEMMAHFTNFKQSITASQLTSIITESNEESDSVSEKSKLSICLSNSPDKK